MSQVKVIRQRRSSAVRQAAPAAQGLPEQAPPPAQPGQYRLLGLVASTGGPKALSQILCALPDEFPLPILVVQHIAASFHGGFIAWLDELCPLTVVEAQAGQRPQPGAVYVAPAERHLWLAEHVFELHDGEPVCGQRPSGTVALRSMAQSLKDAALGVLLTGMGEDGAEGLKAIHDAGGYTIAESEATAVVYGMPAAAVRLGAACESLPLEAIAPRLLALCRVSEENEP